VSAIAAAATIQPTSGGKNVFVRLVMNGSLRFTVPVSPST